MTRSFKEQLATNGYAVIENFLTQDQIDQMKQQVETLVAILPPASQCAVFGDKFLSRNQYFLDSACNISYFFDKGAVDPQGCLLKPPKQSLNKIGHALHELDPVFREVSLSKKIGDCALQLGYKDPAIAQSMYIFKNPGVGGEVVPHQDSWYLYTEPMSLLGFWFALEDATVENGCLWFLEGSHKSGLHRRYIRNPDKTSEEWFTFTAPAPQYEKSQFTAVPVAKGSLVLIHGEVVHFSEPNSTNKSRDAYTFHIIEQHSTRYCEENWLQLPKGRGFLRLFDDLAVEQ